MMPFALVNYRLDTKPILSALERNPQLWDQNPARRLGNSPHAEMRDIWVRYAEDFTIQGPHESIWLPAAELLSEVKAIIPGLMCAVAGERLGGILITKLPAWGEIKPHVDAGWHASYYDKFYLSLKNEEGAIFGFDGGEIKAKTGEFYWFRNDVTHWVKNQCDSERIAMIVCIRTDKGGPYHAVTA